MPKFASVAALREDIVSPYSAEYRDKMLQPVPELPTVKDRAAYLVEKAKGKAVLDIGCTGPISAQIEKAASKYYGFDRADDAERNVVAVELDHRPDLMPVYEDVELVICSEVLEHLANPGYFLLALRAAYEGRPVYVTVPNAGACKVQDGCEIVNGDHVAWYSYSTLRTLLTRYGYTVKAARWYHGKPYTAEGLIMLVE